MLLNELKDLLREKGVVGAGGAGFPSYAKLSDQAETIILNCAECEPLLKVHRQVLEEYPYEILSALSQLVTMAGAKRGIIAIKAHYKSTLLALESEMGEFPSLSIHTLDSVYPMGDEVILVKEVTGKTISPGKLPITVGVVVCNVESVYNVFRAMQGIPVTQKFVTVAGEIKTPKTLCVPLGTKITELIKAVGGTTVEDPAYISGGPMMGRLISPYEVVTKTTNAILVLPKNQTVIMNKMRNAAINLRRAASVCCQCHSCTDLCSRHVIGYPVQPHMVMRVLANGGKGNLYSIVGSMFCSGCGLCETYSCPQDLSPRALIAEWKVAARQNGFTPPVDIELETVKDAKLKRVSVERLTSRLGLKKYDVPAPICHEFKTNTVKVGDRVAQGDLIGKARDGALSVNIHASIDGTVEAVTEKYVKIKQ